MVWLILMIRVNMIISKRIKVTLALILMVIGLKGVLMAKSSFTKKDVQDAWNEIRINTGIVDSVMKKEHNMPEVGEFSTNVALQETWAGKRYDKNAGHTMGPWQIDAIKMYDIQQNLNNSKTYRKRRQTINNYFKSKGYPANFDIAKIATVKKDGNKYSYSGFSQYKNDVLVNAFLARLGLASVKESVPTDNAYKQAEYWKKHWNKSGRGVPTEFLEKLEKFGVYDNQKLTEDSVMYGPWVTRNAFTRHLFPDETPFPFRTDDE